MRKNIFFIVFIILCAVSCTEKKSNFINMVHLKGQLFDMGSQNVRMRFDGAASMLGDSPVILILLLYLKSRHIILSAATHCILLQEMT